MQRQHVLFFITLGILVCLAHGAFAGERDLPKAPLGYSWKWCEEIGAGFLLPEQWYFASERDGRTRSVFLTKESLKKNDTFQTGFTVNVITDSGKTTKMLPSEYATQFIGQMKLITRSHKGITSFHEGAFAGSGGFFVSSSEEGELIVQFTLAIGNDATGTLYIVTFESPESEWDSAWKLGKPIVDTIALDKDF